jgi:hypothetical protein
VITPKGLRMTNRVFKKPEGAIDERNSIEFLRPKELALEVEEGIREVGAPILEGTFVDSMPNRYNASKLDFKFETEDGKTIIVNGSGNLGYNMKLVNVGDYVQVLYHGKKEATTGQYAGTPMHQFEVLTAE